MSERFPQVPAVIEELRAEPEPSMWEHPPVVPEPTEPFTYAFTLCDVCGLVPGHGSPQRRCYCREPLPRVHVLGFGMHAEMPARSERRAA